ncbi:expressed unknown protein [Seminavis robusta]|uniref:Uncharacterized protein n=1 Tax=Seminavis robusta TaxID=568900 RepID=A0A9N8EUP0_9STRA|nr:expressed unknown protein [Seminavis robusta]|eukprot:Sro2004_g310440.1 n/a (688) ;mRNA; r:12285-14348
MDPIEACLAYDDEGPQERKRQRIALVAPASRQHVQEEKKDDESPGEHICFLHSILGAPPSSIQLFHHPTVPSRVVQQKRECAVTCFRYLLRNWLSQENETATGYWDSEQWKELHGFLTLHLNSLFLDGFVTDTPTTTDYDSGNTDKLEMVTLLCQCLQQIYVKSIHKAIYTTEELQVVLDVLVQNVAPALVTSYYGGPDKKNRNYEPQKDELVLVLLDIFRIFVLTQQQHHDQSLLSCEQTCQVLDEFLRCLGNHNNTPESVCQKCSQLQQQLNLLLCSATNSEMATLGGNEMDLKDGETPWQTMRRWRRLAQTNQEVATRMSQNTSVLDQLVDWALTKNKSKSTAALYDDIDVACEAAECLSILATNRSAGAKKSSADSVDWTLSSLLKVLVGNPRTNSGADHLPVKQAALVGLRHCQLASVPWQNQAFLACVVSSLMLIIKTPREWPEYYRSNSSSMTQSHDYKVDAAAMLLDIIEQNQTPIPAEDHAGGTIAVLPYQQAMGHVGELLLMYDESSLQQLAVQYLAREAKANGARLVLGYPTLLNDLGALCCDGLTAGDIKHTVVEILNALSRSHAASLTILARQVKVLDALVAIVSGQQHNNTNNMRTQELALAVLVRLSQDVSNRRIVATHVGVLSCLIRYARAHSNTMVAQPLDNHHHHNFNISSGVSLNHLKERIMELTVAI